MSAAIGIIIILALHGFSRLNNSWVNGLERYSIDRRFEFRGKRAFISDVEIVGIDDSTEGWANRPNALWPPLYGEFIEAMVSASATCVFLDIHFQPLYDEEMRKLVSKCLKEANIELPPPVRQKISFLFSFLSAYYKAKKGGLKLVFALAADEDNEDQVNRFKMFKPEFWSYANLTTDPDQAIRQAPLFFRNNMTGVLYPSVALAVSSILRKCGFSYNETEGLKLGDKKIANMVTPREGSIDFLGPQECFPWQSFKDVIIQYRQNYSRLRERYSGKTVMVGFWGIMDYKKTPFGYIPGVAIHANIVENILRNRFLNVIPDTIAWTSTILFLFVQTWAFSFGIRFGIVSAFFLEVLWLFLCLALFNNSIVLPFSKPACFIFFHALTLGFCLFWLFEKETRKWRNLLGRYVNDIVIESILKNPDNQILQGKRVKICVLMSDIRNFTTSSENRDPQEVVNFLNKYFDGLTKIILKNFGVVDKFLGDGLLAFFNAPIERRDFAKDAVETALEIRDFVSSSEIRDASSSLELKVGIAIHLGEALVGNIGSERKMEYTAIGDTVNTTSRLESLNKELGTDIIASSTVEEATRNDYNWKDLGELKIRGKENAMRLYTLISRKVAEKSGG